VNRYDLAAALERVGVTGDLYIEGPPSVGSPDNALHLRRDADGRWVVGHFERGYLSVFESFDAEADACDYMFLKLVTQFRWAGTVRLTPAEKVRADAFRAEFVARVRAEAEERRRRAESGDSSRWREMRGGTATAGPPRVRFASATNSLKRLFQWGYR
jgi:hypothetical protein